MNNTNKVSNKIRYSNIDFFRVIFTISILYFHLLALYIDNTTNLVFQKLYILVDFFFIISGFFLFNPDSDKVDCGRMILKKIFRLYPTYLFFAIVCHKLDLRYLLMLNSTGLVNRGDFNWFVSALFFTSILFIYLYKNFNTKITNLIIAVSVYFSYIILFNSDSSLNRHVHMVLNVFNCAMLRAIGGIGIGYFIYLLVPKIQCKIKNNKTVFCLFSIAEIYIFLNLFKYLFIKFKPNKPDIDYLLYFIVLFILFLLRKGFLSNLLNKNIFTKISIYSYPVYVMQGFSFSILQKHIFDKVIMTSQHPIVSVIIGIVLSCIIGVLTYHLIEKPSYKILSTKLKN